MIISSWSSCYGHPSHTPRPHRSGTPYCKHRLLSAWGRSPACMAGIAGQARGVGAWTPPGAASPMTGGRGGDTRPLPFRQHMSPEVPGERVQSPPAAVCLWTHPVLLSLLHFPTRAFLDLLERLFTSRSFPWGLFLEKPYSKTPASKALHSWWPVLSTFLIWTPESHGGRSRGPRWARRMSVIYS